MSDFSAQVNAFVFKKNLSAFISYLIALVCTIISLFMTVICPKKEKKEEEKPSIAVEPNTNSGAGTRIANDELTPGNDNSAGNKIELTQIKTPSDQNQATHSKQI